MSFKIVRNDITKMNTEAIVNTANDYPTVGTGCDSAVYKAAGYDKLLEYRKEKIGFVPEGDAFITPGFNLQAKYIIHAVSPLYEGGKKGEEKKLRSCYQKSLELAKKHDIKSIAFPLISTGSFGYPKEEGLLIAINEINTFLLSNDIDIFLVVFDDKSSSLVKNIDPKLEEYIDRHYVNEKYEEEYLYDKFTKTADHHEIYNQSIKYRHREKAQASYDSRSFEGEYSYSFEELIIQPSDSFSQYLLHLIKIKNMKEPDVYKRAIIDKRVFSKIRNNPNYQPQKATALRLCIGAKLTLDESKDLLARAGYAFSPCDKTDIIFSYFIEHEIYDMIELDLQLEEHGLPCIIS